MLEKIRKYCLNLPMVTEDIKWGSVLCFSVAGKLFLVVSLDETPLGVSFKVDDAEYDYHLEQEKFVRAPYFAKMKWVKVRDINSISESSWQNYINKAYMLIKIKLPKKNQRDIDSALFSTNQGPN